MQYWPSSLLGFFFSFVDAVAFDLFTSITCNVNRRSKLALNDPKHSQHYQLSLKSSASLAKALRASRATRLAVFVAGNSH